MKIIFAILIFSIIILFHELGHFLLAKRAGIRVNEFCIGLGPTLVGFTKGETKYSIKLLPFGGACMMEGEDGDSKAEDSFQSKSVGARISVVAAGPVFNFIMAFVLAVILTAMVGYDKPVISSVEEGYSAAEAGIQEGDTIVRMGGKKINIFREITYYNQFHQGETVKVTYLHDGEKHTATLVPKMDDELGYYRIGISGGGNTKANAWTSVQYGVYEVKFWVCTTFESLKQLVTGNVGVKQLSGPVGIVNMVDTTYNESKSYGVFIVIAQFLNIGILLSANLGVMNLLPLPALDGGRLVFLLIEAIRRKRIPPEKEGYVHLAGMALLMILMVVVMYNDIARIFF